MKALSGPVGIVDDIVTHRVAGPALLVAAPRGGRLMAGVVMTEGGQEFRCMVAAFCATAAR